MSAIQEGTAVFSRFALPTYTKSTEKQQNWLNTNFEHGLLMAAVNPGFIICILQIIRLHYCASNTMQ